LEWAHLRGVHAGKHLNIEVGDVVGAEVLSDRDEEWGFILWFHEFKESRLSVLRLREPTSDSALRGLLQAALKEARRFNLSKVTIWSPSRRLEALTAEQIVTRNHSLPALLFLGKGEEREDNESGRPARKLIWRDIEKLGWC